MAGAAARNSLLSTPRSCCNSARRWNTFARRLLLLQLCWFLLWLVSFNVFTIAFQDEDLTLSLQQLLRSTRGRVTMAAELLALVGGGQAGRLAGWLAGWPAKSPTTGAATRPTACPPACPPTQPYTDHADDSPLRSTSHSLKVAVRGRWASTRMRRRLASS